MGGHKRGGGGGGEEGGGEGGGGERGGRGGESGGKRQPFPGLWNRRWREEMTMEDRRCHGALKREMNREFKFIDA